MGALRDSTAPFAARPRIHFSTVLFILLVAAALVAVNLPGQEIPRWQEDMPPGISLWERLESRGFRHGWPAAWLTRVPIDIGGYGSPSCWHFEDGVADLRWGALATNVFVAAAIVAVTGVLFERWRRRRTRLWQFYLRDLLLLLGACAVVGGILAEARLRAMRDMQVLAALQGMKEELGWQRDARDRCRLRNVAPSCLREWLGEERFASFQHVLAIQVEGAELDEAARLPNLEALLVRRQILRSHFEALAKFHRVQAIELAAVKFCDGPGGQAPLDDVLAVVARHHQLKELSLRHSHITPAGLAYVASLPNLERLDLSDTSTGETGLATLERLPLKHLRLVRTPLTDRSVEVLSRFRHLQSLDLSETFVSPEGLKSLREALPECEVIKIETLRR